MDKRAKSISETIFIINLFGFLSVFIFIVLFSLYQSLPWSNYRLKGFIKFLNPATVFTTLKGLPLKYLEPDTSEIVYLQNKGLWQGLETALPLATVSANALSSPIYQTSDRLYSAYLSGSKTVIFQKSGEQPQSQTFPEMETIHIIHWVENSNKLIIAGRNVSGWNIFEVSDKGNKILVKDILYPDKNLLTAVYKPVRNTVIYPECHEQGCIFKAYHLSDGTNSEYMVAIPEDDPSGWLKDIRLRFYDEQLGLIGYERLSGDERNADVFIVVNAKHELVQTVYLFINHQVRMNFLGYLPDKRYMVFESVNPLKSQKDLFLYAADRPSLRILPSVDKDRTITLLNTSGMYAVSPDHIYSFYNPSFTFNTQGKEIIPLR